jgi:hypothetical protein
LTGKKVSKPSRLSILRLTGELESHRLRRWTNDGNTRFLGGPPAEPVAFIPVDVQPLI